MPTVAENKREWDGAYRWAGRGDEWSGPWGNTEFLWHVTLLPRIRALVPVPTILEIACGYGRWTQYLKNLCDRLIAVDLSAECIAACQQRFAGQTGIDYHVNDGKSLAMARDESVDFVFSFDSLVHADLSVLDAYFAELGRVLSRNGAAFLHHSNLGEYRAKYQRIRTVPKLEGLLITARVLDNFLHWRDPGVSAELVADVAESHGLRCITQEVVHWRTTHALIDCLSVVVKKKSLRCAERRLVRNTRFMDEARAASRMSQLYGSL